MRKITVVGNGSIGTLAALSAKKNFPEDEVALVGPASRKSSASAAAGAMANVYAEYENLPESQEFFQEAALRVGLDGRDKWRNFFDSISFDSPITCEDTLVYLKKNSSPFERSNFDAMVRRVQEDSAGDYENRTVFAESPLQEELVESVLRIRGEWGFDVKRLFVILDNLLAVEGIYLLDGLATEVDLETKEIVLSGGERLKSDLVLIAAGAHTTSLLPEAKVPEMFQGAGLALVVSPDSITHRQSISTVIRSVNRGGAQCGVHLVPRADGGLYIGAGNVVLPPGNPPLRFETVRYLLNAVEEEFFGANGAYSFSGEVVLGSRPKTIDGHPIIGPLDENPDIYLISGTNRVGLTWAPALVDHWLKWLAHQESPFYFDYWNPNRDPIEFSDEGSALKYFSESRAGAAFEHGLIERSSEAWHESRETLEKQGRKILMSLPSHLKRISPDSWSSIELLEP